MDIPEPIIKLLIAVLIGGAIGVEREYRHKAAGFRTIIFICAGATLFTVFSKEMGGARDPVRIAANIVSGVGFLGAGAIMHDTGRVMGLTTAATIWLSAALGMGIGAGYYQETALATGVTLVVLLVFPVLEGWIEKLAKARTYEIVSTISPEIQQALHTLFRDMGLRVHDQKSMKAHDNMVSVWFVIGSPKGHDRVTEKLFEHPDVKEFRY
jgi:putative Mg2+ transporter-C (MgtC) family protein